MKRLFVSMFVLAGCASTPRAPREPANLPPAENLESPGLNDLFRDAVAFKALVLAPPNARGEQLPICQIPLLDHPEMSPRFLKTTVSRQTLALDLPACTAEQRSEVITIAANASRPLVAGLEKLLEPLGVCVLNSFSAASIALTYTMTHDRSAPDSALRRVDPNSVAKTATIAGSAYEFARQRPRYGGRSFVALVCAGAGAGGGRAVGYLLAPAKPPK